jgi:hypothetical protein
MSLECHAAICTQKMFVLRAGSVSDGLPGSPSLTRPARNSNRVTASRRADHPFGTLWKLQRTYGDGFVQKRKTFPAAIRLLYPAGGCATTLAGAVPPWFTFHIAPKTDSEKSRPDHTAASWRKTPPPVDTRAQIAPALRAGDTANSNGRSSLTRHRSSPS